MNYKYTTFKKYLLPVLSIPLFILGSSSNIVAQHCIPLTAFNQCEYGNQINNVSLQGETVHLNNPSQCSADGYGDYTLLPTVPDLLAGETYTISVTSNFVMVGDNDLRIWIDYGDDGVFDASDQIGNTNGNGMSSSGTHSFTFTVPNNVYSGNYRMRIRMYFYGGASIDPCANVGTGETEDYLVNIISTLSPPGCIGIPDAGTIMGNMDVCRNMDFDLVVNGANGDGSDLLGNWQSTLTGVDNWMYIQGADDTTYTMSGGIDESMDFRYIVVCPITGEGDTSDIVEVIVYDTLYADSILVTEVDYYNHQFELVNVENAGAYLWDFGDGNTSDEPSPIHSYEWQDGYDVSVTIYHENCEDSMIFTKYIYIEYPDDINELKEERLVVFPNPVKDYLNLKLLEQVFVKGINIYDIQGREVLFQSVQNNISDLNINVGHLPTGIYHLLLETNDGNIKKSFEVSR